MIHKWHEKFHDIEVEYEEDKPTNADYWRSIRKDSLVIIDDLWSLAANSIEVGKAFKVYAKKIGFSLIIVSQVSFLLVSVINVYYLYIMLNN